MSFISRHVRTLKGAVKRAVIPIAQRLSPEPSELPIDRWSLRVDAAGRLRYAGHDVLSLVADVGAPVHLLDVARLDANLDAFQRPRGPSGQAAEVFYSFKTQPLPWIMKRLLSRGAGAEVISEYELRLALHLGSPPERIVFNGPGKSDASIRTAVEAGILAINVNHIEEIERVAAVARELGRKARVGVRVATSGGWSWQFGCSIAGGEAMAAFERALQVPELEVVGLHSHRGALIHRMEELDVFVGEILAFVGELRARLGFEPSIVDFGGSLAVPTVRSFSALDGRLATTLRAPAAAPDVTQSLDAGSYTRRLLSLVDAFFRGRRAPRVLIEPGRAITGDALALATKVITTRASPDGVDYGVLDAGTNVAAALSHERHQIFRVTDFGAPPALSYRLVGPICQPGDVVYQCARLPRLSAGDVLLIMDSGAYLESDSTSFSFQKPGTVALEGDSAAVIRRGETFADMIDRDIY